MQPGILKIFYDEERDRLTVVERDEDGEVLGSHERAEHSFFLATEDVDGDLAKQLRESRYLKKLIPEGQWTRTIWDTRHTCEAVAEVLMKGDPDDEEAPGLRVFDVAIPAWLRFALDRDIKFVRPRPCYFDLETDSRVPFGKKHEARVLAWAVVDAADPTRRWSGVLQGEARDVDAMSEDERKAYDREMDEAERELMNAFFETVDRFDQLAAWNGDRFDFPVLRARIRRLALGKDLRRWLTLDFLKWFKKSNAHAAESGDEKQSFALDEVCKGLKIPEPTKQFDASRTWPMWAAGGQERADLLAGCEHDTFRLHQIEETTGYLGLFASVCEMTGTHHDSSGVNPAAQVESFLLRIAKEKDFRFRMKELPASSEGEDGQEEERSQFRGALVIKPTQGGIIKDVHVCDFSRMYPSIILAWNMSPETIVPKPEAPPPPPLYLQHSPAWAMWQAKCRALDVPPPGVVVAPKTDRWFRTDKRGILCLAVEHLIVLRKKVSEKKAKLAPGTPEFHDLERLDSALKIVLNSFYGVIGSRSFRFNDRDVAEAVAQAGVWLIEKTVIEAQKRLGARLLYGDTDGAYLHHVTREAMEGFARLCNDELFPQWLAEQGCYESGGIKIAYEKAFERIVFPLSAEGEPVAKRYAARYAHYKGIDATAESEPEIKGLEYKRGDTTKLTRDFQREIIDLLMRDCCEDPAVYRALAERWREKILHDELQLKEFLLANSLSKPLSHYARKPKKYGLKRGLVELVGETTSTIQVKFLLTGEVVRFKRADVHEDSQVPKNKRGELLVVDWNEGPAHVRVARLLAKRGQDVGEGTKVRYVIVDGKTSPKTVIPAEDYDGTFDRESFWEDQVWPATSRVLKGAFPGTDWRALDYAKPREPKAPKVSPGRQVTRAGVEPSKGPQMGLFDVKR